MPKPTRPDWTAWSKERREFAKREPQGFTAEIKALEQHIAKLREVCPKDTAGFPHMTALTELNKLQQRLDEAKRYLANCGS